ncbi:Protein TIFY 6B [Quillaja saponaria]|uniref:Protein TIFY n=1 Tax=Quillaja saponaria TaxID=32244 RepID=A0AAD7VGV6_QUISA|nr:Protein TIFY 6B [Quillaja saponaria]
MERDFFGLSSKNDSVTAKEEFNDGPKDSAPVRGSGMQWSFSNKVSALPQFLSFKAAQDDRQRKTVLDPQASTGFMTISTAEALDSNPKPFRGAIQNFDAHSVHPQESRMFPISHQSNQTSHVALSNSIHQSHLASTGQDLVSSAIKPQPLAGVPLISPVSALPSRGSIVGTTDLRSPSKSSGAPAQLTIFYAGSVCVFDDISAEKAQAIMLLAGKWTSPSQNMTSSMVQVQAPMPRNSKDDGFIVNQSHSSALPCPLPLTSHSSQSGGVSCSTNELTMVKPIGSSSTPSNHLEPHNVVSCVGSAPTPMIPSVALPQARKASLARFLEKRKERVMSTSPYSVSKKSPDCGMPGSEGFSFTVSSAGS